MADIKISEATDAGDLLGDDMLPLARSGSVAALHATLLEIQGFTNTTPGAGASNDLVLSTGSASAGPSGNILLSTGPATEEQGNIILNAPSFIHHAGVTTTFGPDPGNQGVYGMVAEGFNIMATNAGGTDIGAWIYSANATSGQSASCGVGTGNTSNGAISGDVWVYSGNVNSGAGNSGTAFLWSGDVQDGRSGDVHIGTGWVHGTGTRGNIVLDTLLVTTPTSAGLIIQSDDNMNVGTNDQTGTAGSATAALYSGNAQNAASGWAMLYSGDVTGSGASGQALIGSGNTASGASGTASVYTGDSSAGNSGPIGLSTGQAPAGSTGAITLLSGNAGAGNSGDINLQTGTATATRGSIQLRAPNVLLLNDPTAALGAATKQYVDSHAAGVTEAPSDGAYYTRRNTAWANVALAPQVQVNVGRNQLINSLFGLGQRGAGPFTATGYTLDRWVVGIVTDTASFSQIAAADADRAAIGDESAAFLLQNVFTGNAAAGAYNQLVQRTENVRRLANKTVTVSFWAKASSGTPKLGLNILQSFGTGGAPSAAVQALATGNAVTLSTTWTRYTSSIAIPSIAGKTLGTNGDSHTALQIWYSSGSTNNALAGNIGVQSGTIQLWGVQLEIGGVATPLEKLDPQQEVGRCQRFYVAGQAYLVGYASGAGQFVGGTVGLPVAMRAAPVVTVGSTIGTDSNVSAASADNYGINYFRFVLTGAGAGMVSGARNFTATAEL